MRSILYRFGIVLFLFFLSNYGGTAQITLEWSQQAIAAYNAMDCGDGNDSVFSGNRVQLSDAEGTPSNCARCQSSLLGCPDDPNQGVGMCSDLAGTIVSNQVEILDFEEVVIRVALDSRGGLDDSGFGCNSDDRIVVEVATNFVDGSTIVDELLFAVGNSTGNFSLTLDNSCSDIFSFTVVLIGGTTADDEFFDLQFSFDQTLRSGGLPALGNANISINPALPCPGDVVNIGITNCPSCTFVEAVGPSGIVMGDNRSVDVPIPTSASDRVIVDFTYGNASCNVTVPIPIDLFSIDDLGLGLIALFPNLLFPEPICQNTEIDLNAVATNLTSSIGLTIMGNWIGDHISSGIFNPQGIDPVPGDGVFRVTYESNDCGPISISQNITVDEAANGNCSSGTGAVVEITGLRVSVPANQVIYCMGQSVFLTALADDACNSCTFEWVNQFGQVFPGAGPGDPTAQVTLSQTASEDVFELFYNDGSGNPPVPVTPLLTVPIIQLSEPFGTICEGDSFNANSLLPPQAINGDWTSVDQILDVNEMTDPTTIPGNYVLRYTTRDCLGIPYEYTLTVLAGSDLNISTNLETRCDSGNDDIDLDATPFNTALGGDWFLNGNLATGVIPIASLNSAMNPQVLEFMPDDGICVINSRLEFNVAQGIGTVQIFGDTAAINSQLYCPGDMVPVTVTNLANCGSCTFFWEEFANGDFIETASNSDVFTVNDNSNISFNTYRFTYTDNCVGTPSGDTLEWRLTPVTVGIQEELERSNQFCNFFSRDATPRFVFGQGEIDGIPGTFSDPTGAGNVTPDGSFTLSNLPIGFHQFEFTPSACQNLAPISFDIIIRPDITDMNIDPLPFFCMADELFNLDTLIPAGNGTFIVLDQDGIDVNYMAPQILPGTQLLDLNQPPGTYTLTYEQVEFTNPSCLVGQLDIEILAPIDQFNDGQLCETGNPVNLLDFNSGFAPNGTEGIFESTDGSATVAINGNDFDPSSVPPGVYQIGYTPPTEYEDCNLNTFLFNITVQAVVENPIIVLPNAFCSIVPSTEFIDALFGREIGMAAVGTFTIITNGDASTETTVTTFDPSVLGVGTYLLEFTPQDLNTDCQTFRIEFEVVSPDNNDVIVRDTALCEISMIDLEELIQEGPTTGSFMPDNGSIGLMDSNFNPPNSGTFTFTYTVEGTGCQPRAVEPFTITVGQSEIETFTEPNTLCSNTPAEDLNDRFFTNTRFNQVPGTYTIELLPIGGPLAQDDILDYSQLTPGDYSVKFTPDIVDVGDGCIELQYDFTLQASTANAGVANSGSTCPVSDIDLTAFITPDPANGFGTFEQISGDVIAISTDMADFDGAMPDDYMFWHIVEDMNCPGIADTTEFTVTIEAGILLMDNPNITVCEGSTTADLTAVCAGDCSIFTTPEDLANHPISSVLAGTSETIELEYISSTANGVNCLSMVSVTVTVLEDGGTVMVDDIELCPGEETNVDLTAINPNFDWYIVFDPTDPTTGLIPNPDMADLTTFIGGSITAVSPDPMCPSSGLVNVVPGTNCAPNIDIPDQTNCAGDIIDLNNDVPGAMDVTWFFTYDLTTETGVPPMGIANPEMFLIDPASQVLIAVNNQDAQDTVQVNFVSLEAPAVQFAQPDGGPTCSFAQDGTYFFQLDLGSPDNQITNAGILGAADDITGNILSFSNVDPSIGAFLITVENINTGCEIEFMIEPPADDCGMPVCDLPEELMFDLTDDFVCSSDDLPVTITIQNANPTDFIYQWLDAAGNILDPGATSFMQVDTGLLQIRVESRVDANCFDIVDTTGVRFFAEVVRTLPPPLTSCDPTSDIATANFNVPEYAGTTIVPTVSAGNIEVVDAATGDFMVSFSTNDQLSVEVSLPPLAGAGLCETSTFTVSSANICEPVPNCDLSVFPSTLPVAFSDIPCNSASFPITLSILGSNRNMFNYFWIDEDGNIASTSDRVVQTELGEFTIRVELRNNPNCFRDDYDPVGITEFNRVPEPMVSGFCDQDIWRATFIVPEYARTSIVPIVSDPDGTIIVVDATTGEFEVSFSTDVQMSIGVALPPASGTCPSSPFTISADMVCMADPACPLAGMLTIQPTGSLLCDDTDFPFGLIVGDADPNVEYTWTDAEGDVLNVGETFDVTQLIDTIFVRGVLLSDPTCTAESLPFTAAAFFGTPQEPALLTEACDQGIYTATFIVPEYANTANMPTVSSGTVNVLDAATGLFEVTFDPNNQLSVNVELASIFGNLCSSTSFPIDASVACDPGCPLSGMLAIQPTGSLLCDDTDFPFGLMVGDANSNVEYTWTNAAGDILNVGATFEVTQLIDTIFVRGVLLSDPTCTAESLPFTAAAFFGTPQEPALLTEDCDQGMYTATFIVPEYATTANMPTVSAGTVNVLDAATGLFEVTFDPNNQLSISVELASIFGNLCDSTSFPIDATNACDPGCPLSSMLAIQPTGSLLCDNTDFPFGLMVGDANPNVEYTWTNTSGDILNVGATFDVTQLIDTIFVRGVLLSDPTCTAESLPFTAAAFFGTPQTPALLTEACVQDRYTATFIVPEYATTSNVPTVSAGTVTVLDPTMGLFEVSFDTNDQLIVIVELASIFGNLCSSTSFMIDSGTGCQVPPVCDLPTPVSLIQITVACDVNDAAIFGFNINDNPDFDDTIHGVRWFDASDPTGTPIDSGQQIQLDQLGEYFIRFFLLSDPTCQSDASQTIEFSLPDLDPSFTIDDFCLGDPVAPIITGTQGGEFSFVTPPADGSTIDDQTGLITSNNPNGMYEVMYTVEDPSGTCSESSTQTVSIAPAATIGGMVRTNLLPPNTYEVIFTSDGDLSEFTVVDQATNQPVGMIEPCTLPTCGPLDFRIFDIPDDVNITLSVGFIGSPCTTTRIFTPPAMQACNGFFTPQITLNPVDTICENELIPTLEVSDADRDAIIAQNMALGLTSAPDSLRIIWYDVEIGGTILAEGFTFTPPTAGTYYATQSVIIPGGTNICEFSPRTEITIEEIPLANASFTIDSFCEGQTSLLPNVSQGGGVFTIDDPNVVFIDDSTGEIDTTTLVVGTSYNLTYTVGTICPNSTQVSFTFVPALNPTIMPAVCNANNDAVSIIVMTVGEVVFADVGTIISTGPDQFTIEDIPLNTPVNIDVESPGDCGIFPFEITSGESCSTNCPVPQFVSGTPMPFNFCEGDMVRIEVDTSLLGPDDMVEWFTMVDPVTGNPLGAPVAIGGSIIPTQTEQFFVRVVNAVIGCESVTVPINVIANPISDATFSYNTRFCEGDPIMPNSANDNETGFTSRFDIERLDGAPVTTFNNSTGELTNPLPGIYEVTFSTLEPGNMCVDTMRQQFEVFPPPVFPDTMFVFDPVNMTYILEIVPNDPNDAILDVSAGLNPQQRPDGVWEILGLIPGQAGTVTIINGDGCDLVIDIIPPPLVDCSLLTPPADPIVPPDLRSVCFEPDLSLDLTVIAMGMIRVYENSDRTQLAAPNLSNFDPNMPDTFFVETVNSDGCVSDLLDTIIIQPIPTFEDTMTVFDPLTGLSTFTFTTFGTVTLSGPSVILNGPDLNGVYTINNIDSGTTISLSAVSDAGCMSEVLMPSFGGTIICPAPVVPPNLEFLCTDDSPFDLSGLGQVQLFEDRDLQLGLLAPDLTLFSIDVPDTLYVVNECSGGLTSIEIDSIIIFPNPAITDTMTMLDAAQSTYSIRFRTDGIIAVNPAGLMPSAPDANGFIDIEDIDPGTTVTIVSISQVGCESELIVSFPTLNTCPTAPVIDSFVTPHDVLANGVLQIEYCLSNEVGALPPLLEVQTNIANGVEWFEDPNGPPVETTLTFQPMTAGTFFVRAILNPTCVGTLMQIDLIENVGPDILNNAIVAECDMTNGGYFFTVMAPDAVDVRPVNRTDMVTNLGGGEFMISGIPAGIPYLFEAIGANTCSTLRSAQIPQDACVSCNPPPAAPTLVDASQMDITICTNEVFPTLVVDAPPSGFDIEWVSNGQVIETGTQLIVPANQQSGVIQALITDGIGNCVGMDSLEINVTVQTAPVAPQYAATNCLSDVIGPAGTFTPGGTFRLISQSGTGTIGMSTGILDATSAGSFSIEYEITEQNCTTIDTIDIMVDNPDTTFYNIVDFDLNANTFGIEFGVSPTATPVDPPGFMIEEDNGVFSISDIPVTAMFDLVIESLLSTCTNVIPVSFNIVCPPIPAPVIMDADPFEFCSNLMNQEIIPQAEANQIVIWYDDAISGQEIARGAFNPQQQGVTGTRTIFAEAIDTTSGCTSTLRSSISLSPLPFLEAGPDITIPDQCFRDPIAFTDFITKQGNSRFEFQGNVLQNDVLETEFIMPLMDYVIDYIVDNDMCGEDTARIMLFLDDCRPPANFTSVISNTLCEDTNDGEIILSFTQEQFDLYTYTIARIAAGVAIPDPVTIDPVTLMSTISNLQPGDYEITAFDGTDVFFAETITVGSPLALNVDIQLVSNTTCAGDTDGSIQANISGGTEPYTLDWSNGAIDELLSNLGEGMFSVTVTDANGCSTDPADIELIDAGAISFENVVLPPTCPDQPDGSIEFTNVTGGEAPLTFFLNNQSDLDGVFNNLDLGTFFPSVEDARGCRVNGAELIIDGFEGGDNISLAEEAFADPGEVVTIQLAINFTPMRIEWSGEGLSCTDCVDPSFTMTDRFRFFEVVVTNEFGCEFTAEIVYLPTPDPAIYIPNAIRLSGTVDLDNGINNTVFIPVIAEGANVQSMSIQIYDVWGELVHDATSSNPNDLETLGWAGTLSETRVSQNVYSYVVRVQLAGRAEEIERVGTFVVFY